MIFCTKNLAESQKSCIFVAYKQSNGNIDILNILLINSILNKDIYGKQIHS